jgi:hypothetical protein
LISRYIKPILIVTGLITASMTAAVFAPALVLDQLFAEPPSDAVTLAVMRHWGLLVFCFGGLLVWAAYRPDLRKPVLVFTIVEKVALVLGILLLPLALKSGAYVAASTDATLSIVYLLYLAGL